MILSTMAYPQEQFSLTTFAPESFWARRRLVARSQTLRHQLQMLKSTGRYDAFKLQWHPSYGDPCTFWPIPNHLFWDSDIAKWIEGACYFLTEQFDEEIDAAVRDLVLMIQNAQQADGYLNIHYTVVEPGKRFTNLRDMHELYNAGHLIEAALAHKQYYKSDDLFAPILRYVNLLVAAFGSKYGQKPGYPGHPEIELALLRLYKVTSNEEHLRLAQFFIEERGNPTGGPQRRHYFDIEAEARGESENTLPAYYPEPRSYWYQQAHKPIAEQATVQGHSVRAMYLLAAVADLIRISPPGSKVSSALHPALKKMWSNMVEKKMYVTGGIGAVKKWEGFGIDYFLPHGTDEGGCYAETCAAIGIMMLAERILQFDLSSQFADIMELCLYNAVLTGMSLDGKSFTYVNQLASSKKDLSQRFEWFECACCPPNVVRTLGCLGGYVWNLSVVANTMTVNVHLYTAATLQVRVAQSTVLITQSTDWPSSGSIDFQVEVNGPAVDVELRLRVPGWTESFEITPHPDSLDVRQGYVYLPSAWVQANPRFRLDLPMKPRVLYPNPLTLQPVAYVARGPIIYCVEDVDHPWEHEHFKRTLFDTDAPLREEIRSTPESFVAIISENGAKGQLDISPWTGRTVASASNKNPSLDETPRDLIFIPYYLRANRGGDGQMRVGLRIK